MNLKIEIEFSHEAESGYAAVMAVVGPEHTVRQLSIGLAQFFAIDEPHGLHRQHRGQTTQLHPDQTLGDAGLLSGDRLVWGAVGKSDSDELLIGRKEPSLVVTNGQDFGSSRPLTAAVTVGTGTANDLPVTDRQIAGSEFTVEPTGNNGNFTITVTPRESDIEIRNPVRRNGALVDAADTAAVGDSLVVGQTKFEIRAPHTQSHGAADQFGRIPFHPTPHVDVAVEPKPFAPLGDLPTKPKPRPLQVATILSPAVLGLLMFVVFERVEMLLLMAASALIAIVNLFETRWRGGKEYESNVEELDDRRKERSAELHRAFVSTWQRRASAVPNGYTLFERAVDHDRRLWQRSRSGKDFLSLDLGSGDDEAALMVKPETTGEKEHRDAVADDVKPFKTLKDVPITVDFAQARVVSLIGDADQRSQNANSLAFQAAALHSPEDLVIAAATPMASRLPQWLKWLPHTHSNSSPIAGDHIATDAEEAQALIREVSRVADVRASIAASNVDVRWPWILLILDRDLDVEPGLVSRLMERSDTLGFSVLWLTDTEDRVPRQTSVIVRLNPPDQIGSTPGEAEPSTVEFAAEPKRNRVFKPNRIPELHVAEAARAMAPLRDASALNAASAVPTKVTLFDALQVDDITPDWVREQWLINADTYSLKTRIGLTDSGPVEIDLVKDGPHGLIGGTSGAGKSELVQSLVANLMVLNSPQRVNVLFVDYKGGALSSKFTDAPHFAGSVTNLDPLLAKRVLVSLRAELDARMRLFRQDEFMVEDIKQMLEKFPDDAPPSLVIVVDEFASLVRELPDFVDEVVSIAERGRSLGVHLMLSTQRPSGSINENIQQNTNLRLSLRMLDATESNNVIRTADAALIPAHLKGRGYARLGPGELIAFQSAFSAAPMPADVTTAPIRIRSFSPDKTTHRPEVVYPPPIENVEPVEETTQLQHAVAAVAAAGTGMLRWPRPWLDPLPPLLELGHVLAEHAGSPSEVSEVVQIALGMMDVPEEQAQQPLVIDLNESGGLVIYGGSGAGKTTALSTAAVSAAAADTIAGGDKLTIVGMDFASRQLSIINALPQSVPVVRGDDLEAVTRTIALLESLFDQRQEAQANAVVLGEPLPDFAAVLLLVDGYDNFEEQFAMGGGPLPPWSDRMNRLIARGREVRIYPILTTASTRGSSARIRNVIGDRVVLRQTDEAAYRDLGVAGDLAKDLVLAPGQGFFGARNMVQIGALCSPDEDGEPVYDPRAIAHLSNDLSGQPEPLLLNDPLEEQILFDELNSEQGSAVVELGLADITLRPTAVDLTMSGLVVIGPPRSGRTTTLDTIMRTLAVAGHEVWVAGSRDSALRETAAALGLTNAMFGSTDVAQMLEEMASAPPRRTAPFLVVDDVDRLDDRVVQNSAAMKTLVENGVRIIGSAIRYQSLSTVNALTKELRMTRNLLVLGAEDETALQTAGRVRSRPGLGYPPGRAVLIRNGSATTIQVRIHSSRAEVISLVEVMQ